MAVLEGAGCLRVWWSYGYLSYMFISFGHDFCSARHSSSELCSALTYRKNLYILRRKYGYPMKRVAVG